VADIIIVFRKIEEARSVRADFIRWGFSPPAVTSSGMRALSLAAGIKKGLIVCGYRAADISWAEIADSLPAGFAMLLLAREPLLAEPRDQGIACLPLSVRGEELRQEAARLLEEQKRSARKGLARPARSREDSEAIARAKEILMEKKRMREPEAHRYLQKTAMETGSTLVETACMVLELFGP
jgi:response regulator NasT